MGCCCSSSANAVEREEAPLTQGRGNQPASKPGKAIPAAVIAKKVEQAKKTGALALRECGLRSLPPEAVGADAGGLRTVDLTSNGLKELPAGISAWTGLQNLLCAQNALVELPPGLGQLTNLQKLALSGNQLRSLPAEMCQLGRLRIVELANNSLGPRLDPQVFGVPLAAAVEELDLTGNGLEELPDGFGAMGRLVRLTLTRNRLRQLPEELGSCTKLQTIEAADNLLSSVPAGILQGTAISELWLKGNPMDRLQLQETPGFQAFLERRKSRIDARIEAKVVGAIDLTVCGLD